MPTRTRRPAKRQGLSPKTFKGLNKKRIEQKGSGSGKRLAFRNDEPTQTIQFLQKPEEFMEFEVHAFQEDGRWHFVPCAGKDDCPLCDSDDERTARPNYRFAANVLNMKTGKVQILEGPKTLAGLIFYRYERKPTSFLKRVFDVTKFPTQPVTYNFELAEEDAVSTRGKTMHDLEEYLIEEMKAYYGDELDAGSAANLRGSDDEDEEDEDDYEDEEDEEEDDDLEDEDADDEDEDEDDEEEDEDEEDDEEEDEEDEDDEDEEDEDEEDEEPVRRRAPAKKAAANKRVPAKKAVAKKAAPAKKAVARKSTTRR